MAKNPGLTVSVILMLFEATWAASTQARYYAHEAVLDEHGVIAPWYQGANGQIDERIRVAAETLKRYPWTPPGKAPRQLPEYMWCGAWKIAPDGTITIPPIKDWANGDLGQRAAYVLGSLVDYYRYSGEAWAVDHVRLQADMLLDFCLTGDDHPWPRFLISVPTKGKPYGPADPHGFIQLDIVAEVGIQMVRAAQLCGNDRYMEAAKHWGDLLAERRIREPGVNPWPRYANPADAPWEDVAKGGVAFILEFFDELIRSGYTGKDNAILDARKAGVAYLRDVLLPNWTGHDTWGRNYWDWPCPVQVENVTEFVVRYLMDHPDEFPKWKNDARNILTLFINRTCAAPGSGGEVFSGAWAYPESSGCCGRSLWYGPFELAFVYGQYAALAKSDWAREMARRQLILTTYDFHLTGVVEDGIDGGPVVAGDWFKIAHPMALKHCLAAIAWMPETFGPPGEDHIVTTGSTASDVKYEPGQVSYRLSPASTPPRSNSMPVDVLRLSFEPSSVVVGGKTLDAREQVAGPGYAKSKLPGGDWIVSVRHEGEGGTVKVTGQQIANRFAETVKPTWGSGGGPTGPQRWIFGYTGREDYVDKQGHAWRPATEWVVRAGDLVDTVAAAWYAERRRIVVDGTDDPELYRHGAHAKEFWANFTVGPGAYHARLKFAENRYIPPEQRAVTILINGTEVVSGMDVAATAAGQPSTQPARSAGGHLEQPEGMGRAVDLVFNGIQPRNGIVEIRFKGSFGGEAIVQAIEVGPGDGGQGATPVAVQPAKAAEAKPQSLHGNLLVNGGFEDGGPRDLGMLGKTGQAAGWTCTFASPGTAYIWYESDYAAHPDWGMPAYHSGKQALRTHADTAGHTLVYQEVEAQPETDYVASVWVRTDDLHGKGFGMNASDSAGLLIQEMDKTGKLIASQPKQAVTARADYRRLSVPFRTSKTTAKIRFVLETLIHCPYNEGHVTYDDCMLLEANAN